MSSDNVNLISYTQNITSGNTATTEKVLLGQYISLSIIGKCDQDLSVIIDFSGDGSYWDYSVTKTLPASSNTQLSSPVLAKWTRLRITNNGLIATTYLRLYVYGTPSNSSIVAQIGKLGNVWPSINIDNLNKSAFGELINVSPLPVSQYIWTYATNGNMLTKTYKTPYGSEITSWSTGFAGLLGATINFDNGICKFGSNGGNGDRALFAGRTFRYRSGQGLSARFTGYFTQSTKNIAGNHPVTQYIGLGNWDTSTYRPVNGYFFGYGDPSLTLDVQNSFGIIWMNDGVRTFYPRTIWNVDKADGSYILPNIDITKMNVYKIDLQFLGFGIVRFYIEDTDGEFKLVHTINRVNSVITPANVRDPSFAFVMFQETEAGVIQTSLTDAIGSSSVGIFLQGLPLTPNVRVSVDSSKLAVSAETAIINIRCDPTYYGRSNWYTIMLDFLGVSTDGTKPALLKMYRNCTIGGVPVWTTPQPNLIPLSYDVAGTFGGLGSGVTLLSLPLDKSDKGHVDLEDYEIYFIPNDIITITIQSTANTDVIVSASCHVV